MPARPPGQGAPRYGPRCLYHAARTARRNHAVNTAFSATRVIGGKLRALYDDAAQPCPDRLARLLTELNVDSLVSI